MELDRRFAQWPIGTPRIKWSAVFAGWAVGLALQIVLTLAGLGFGAWAIDLHDANPGEDVPVGAAIWTGLSMLLSAFIAGYMTAGCSGSADRRDGLYHGVVVWGVNWLVCAWLTTTAMATMIGGAFSVFGTTLQTLEQALAQLDRVLAAGAREKIEEGLGRVGRVGMADRAPPEDGDADRHVVRLDLPVRNRNQGAIAAAVAEKAAATQRREFAELTVQREVASALAVETNSH